MNILLWVLQVLAALLYGASGVMKVCRYEVFGGNEISLKAGDVG